MSKQRHLDPTVAELIALTKHCLAAELWGRPRHAGEVAEQVTAYQQSVMERLRQAELAETEAWERAEEEAKTRAEAEARLSAERQARWLTLVWRQRCLWR